jgi:hypothetical protein
MLRLDSFNNPSFNAGIFMKVILHVIYYRCLSRRSFWIKNIFLLAFLSMGNLGFLTGCTGLSSDRYLFNKRSFMLSEDHPPAYVAGYVDGCSAGRRLAGDNRFVYRKDSVRFDKDALYAQGWQEGQINCRNEALAEEIHPVPSNQGRHKASHRTLRNVTEKVEVKKTTEEDQAVEAEMRQMWEELRK